MGSMAYYKEVILMWLLSFFVFTIQALNPVLFFDDFDNEALPGWRISNNVGVFANRGTLFMGRDADILTRDPGLTKPVYHWHTKPSMSIYCHYISICQHLSQKYSGMDSKAKAGSRRTTD